MNRARSPLAPMKALASARLARFLPTDSGYAPFGWRWLRGLNVLPIALLGFVCLLSGGVEELAQQVSFRDTGALMPSLVDALGHLPAQLVMPLVTLMPMVMAAVVAINLTERRSSGVRIAALVLAVGLGASLTPLLWSGVGCAVGEWPCKERPIWHPAYASLYIRAALAGMLMAVPIYFYRRERDATRTLHETKLQRLNAQREETEGRLRSLQAQIEPHFLFNTLAHIRRLHEVDARQGRAMLNSLIDYMRSALPQMREPESTLGRELALTRAYVNVQQIRMGERLRAEIDVPTALLQARLPAMMVLTLAENAVKHGLGPKRGGGTLRISAARAGDRLEVVVSDDGVGLRLGAGPGHGLSNTRARLAAQFGARAELDIGNNPSGGVRAALVLPLALVGSHAGAL